jgi:arsenate reductase-like glutaredoxin family protein
MDVSVYFNPACTNCRTAEGILIRGDRAVIARPPERLLELLDD